MGTRTGRCEGLYLEEVGSMVPVGNDVVRGGMKDTWCYGRRTLQTAAEYVWCHLWPAERQEFQAVY